MHHLQAMLLTTHDRNLNLKPFDVIELQGFNKNQVNGKNLIVLSKPPVWKATCNEFIGKEVTTEWMAGCDLAEMMEGISLDVPGPMQSKNL